MLNNNIRIDLHIHSKASEYKEENGYVDESNIENVNDLLSRLQENNINLISITDHNKFDFKLYEKIKSLINKEPYNNIKNILPGVEFDVKLEEKSKFTCHIICIFDDIDFEKLKLIQSKIDEVKTLTNKDEFYTLEEFENILNKIKLSVVLIAHQKSGLDISDTGKTHHSLSEAVDNPAEWIKTGYISALEYQKPKVQGIIKNNLNDLKIKFSTITGSDCHVWKAYPQKDKNAKQNDNYITKIKALPTFKGLVLALTSPETRFDRKDEGHSSKYLDSIKIDGNDYKLSTGINAIIGENGSGKSFLLSILNNEKDSIYKKINDINDVKLSKIGEPTITKINQGEIIQKVKSGKLLDNNSDYYDEIPTLEEFKNSMRTFTNSLKEYIFANIKQNEEDDEISNCNISIKNMIDVKNYYVSLNVDIETVNNIPKERQKEINKIYSALLTEYENNTDYYETPKKEKIETILTTLQDLNSMISKESEIIEDSNRVINIVTSAFDNEKDNIRKDRTSQENEKEEYIGEIRDFATKIKNYLNISKKENKYPIFPKELDGTSVKSKSGFKFIKEAKYHNQNLESALYKELFVQSYQTKEKLKQINNKEEFAKAVAGVTSYDLIETKMASNLEKFVSEYTKEETRIKDENGTDEIGITPGEIALTFYKLSLSKELSTDVILIDQPEDDISMKRIESYMLNYFNSVRDKKQVIFVTHNPLLVVNLDVDNVINVNKDRKNVINIESGCLESSNMIDLVSQNLDGGKEAIERRLKIYGNN